MAEKKKLTLRVDSQWIEPAKKFAHDHNTSLSRLVSEYLRRLVVDRSKTDHPPILKRLTGVLPADVSAEEHREHLVEKYGG